MQTTKLYTILRQYSVFNIVTAFVTDIKSDDMEILYITFLKIEHCNGACNYNYNYNNGITCNTCLS